MKTVQSMITKTEGILQRKNKGFSDINLLSDHLNEWGFDSVMSG